MQNQLAKSYSVFLHPPNSNKMKSAGSHLLLHLLYKLWMHVCTNSKRAAYSLAKAMYLHNINKLQYRIYSLSRSLSVYVLGCIQRQALNIDGYNTLALTFTRMQKGLKFLTVALYILPTLRACNQVLKCTSFVESIILLRKNIVHLILLIFTQFFNIEFNLN